MSDDINAAPGASGNTPALAAPKQPWHGPLPTLEGLPPFSPAKGAADAKEPAVPTCILPTAQTGARNPQSDPDFLLHLYLRDAQGEPRLTAREEMEMGWLASLGDDAARERLVLGNLRLVVHIAFAYRGFGLPLCDLISEGNLGMMRATELFKPGRGSGYASYAAWWIRQRMMRALNYQAGPVRMPSDFSWQQRKLRKAEARLSSALDPAPAEEDLAAECGFSQATVRRLRSARLPTCLPLHCPLFGEQEGEALADILPDEHAPAPDQELLRRDDREFLDRLLATLKPREQQVLRLRFGLDDGCERTLEEAGELLGYVRQGIHRIESAALAKLRRRAASLDAALGRRIRGVSCRSGPMTKLTIQDEKGAIRQWIPIEKRRVIGENSTQTILHE